MSTQNIRVRDVVVRPVLAPMRRPLCTATGQVTVAPLLLIDLLTDAGYEHDLVGRSYLFSVSAEHLAPLTHLVRAMGQLIKGAPLAPRVLEERLRERYRLLGLQHLVLMALAGIDMAAWDALGQALDQPLAALLGGEPRPVRAYNSNGLGLQALKGLARETEELMSLGLPGIKLRLGYPSLAQDLQAVETVQRIVGPEVALMVDYNQALTVTEAIRRGQALDQQAQLCWIEEPVRADDFEGCALVAQAVRTPIQMGENLMGPQHMALALKQRCCDFIMPDVQRLGGVSAWLRAAALADAMDLEMSSHLFPEVSASLLCVTPTAHWLEYVDWADAILENPLVPRAGEISPAGVPGSGLRWLQEAVDRYRVDH